ncbi:FkbM family methyltransferase [Cyclobacteriaceae bacterium YHN15]|jgi:FkbM family methyltransferase|nr:FkbM family methyltransferase [Cyclobacteriaceae bacterium YHN15]
MEKFAASFSRNLYIIPGGYFLVQFLKKLFHKKYKKNEWRIFSFRGITMKVDVSKSMGSAIYWRGAHDWRPIFAMEKLLKKGHTVVDIGANQGEYSLWSARIVGEKGKVYAFEPLSTIFGSLKENITLNPSYQGTIIPIQLGLSDKQGKLKLYSSNLSNEGVNTLYKEEDSVYLEEIELSTLDKEWEKLGMPKLDAIKIDVEGAELPVLLGAEKTIAKFSPVLFIEINQEACKAAGYQANDILQFLGKFGYSFELIGLRGKTSKLIPERIPDFCNIIAKN